MRCHMGRTTLPYHTDMPASTTSTGTIISVSVALVTAMPTMIAT